jgi:hypothetical protein
LKFDLYYQDWKILSIQIICRFIYFKYFGKALEAGIIPQVKFLQKGDPVRKCAPIVQIICLFSLLLTGCGHANAPAVQIKDPAAKAVEDYLNALVNKNSDALSTLSCADWESQALLELDAFQAVSTRLQNLACSTASTDGMTSQVDCQGKILATYNGEDQQFDLSVRTYKVIQQGSEYLVCGYQ